ncbi:para-aminobenzoate synthase, (PABA) [Mucor velutinosus]|uniref:Para-aminobenzoate synthase, (PABA) n=1 Tax=Mucor velutinosus TaxID=708070 RepID=A0AAN7I3M1_9FUNG|nr:para-aminobenzoate synthase, (PABA) [Mucor velutinosus]
MATTVQHNPALLQQQQAPKQQQNHPVEDEDVALANYISTSLRFDQNSQDLWNYTQSQQLAMAQANPMYYNTNYFQPQLPHQQQQQQTRPHRTRVRVPSNSTQVSNGSKGSHIQVQKSTSTPITTNPSAHLRPNGRKSSSKPATISQSTKYNSASSITSSSVSSSSSSYPVDSSSSVKNSRRRSMNSAKTLQQQSPPQIKPASQERRPSMTGSVVSSSGVSIQSEMSVNTKLSLSKRLRKVFSMNNLRSSSDSSGDLASLAERNGSNSSIASSSSMVGSPLSQSSVDSRNPMSLRRRSIASLSSLFQRGSSVSDLDTQKKSQITAPQQVSSSSSTAPTNNTASRRHSSGDLRQLIKQEKKKPQLRVDTDSNDIAGIPTRKGGLKVRSSSSTSNNNVTPDSPNSAISSRSSFTRLPPPATTTTTTTTTVSNNNSTNNNNTNTQRNFIHLPEPGLPSPTPSTASSIKHNDEEYIKPTIGLHYGLGLHGSPKLRPASSSTSSLAATTERRIQFCSTIQVHETFSAADYDRRCDNNATCQKLTPMMAMKIKQELNEYKLTDMEVHVESRQYTHFFL